MPLRSLRPYALGLRGRPSIIVSGDSRLQLDRRLQRSPIKDDIDPIVAGIEVVGREDGAGAVGVDAIAATRPAGQRR